MGELVKVRLFSDTSKHAEIYVPKKCTWESITSVIALRLGLADANAIQYLILCNRENYPIGDVVTDMDALWDVFWHYRPDDDMAFLVRTDDSVVVANDVKQDDNPFHQSLASLMANIENQTQLWSNFGLPSRHEQDEKEKENDINGNPLTATGISQQSDESTPHNVPIHPNTTSIQNNPKPEPVTYLPRNRLSDESDEDEAKLAAEMDERRRRAEELALERLRQLEARRKVSPEETNLKIGISSAQVPKQESTKVALSPVASPPNTVGDLGTRLRYSHDAELRRNADDVTRTKVDEVPNKVETDEERAKRKIAEARRKLAEEAEARRLEDESYKRRLAQEEEEARRIAEEEAEIRKKVLEARRKAAEEAEVRRLEEEAFKRAQEEEEARRIAEEEAEVRRKVQEARRKAAEEAEARRLEEEAQKRQAEVEALRAAEEEAEVRRRVQEARRKAAEVAEARRVQEEAQKRRAAQEEADAKRAAEEELRLRRLAQQEAEARRVAEEEAEVRRKVQEARRRAAEEAEAQRRRLAKEEADARREADEEAQIRREVQEARRKSLEDEQFQLQKGEKLHPVVSEDYHRRSHDEQVNSNRYAENQNIKVQAPGSMTPEHKRYQDSTGIYNSTSSDGDSSRYMTPDISKLKLDHGNDMSPLSSPSLTPGTTSNLSTSKSVKLRLTAHSEREVSVSVSNNNDWSTLKMLFAKALGLRSGESIEFLVLLDEEGDETSCAITDDSKFWKFYTRRYRPDEGMAFLVKYSHQKEAELEKMEEDQQLEEAEARRRQAEEQARQRLLLLEQRKKAQQENNTPDSQRRPGEVGGVVPGLSNNRTVDYQELGSNQGPRPISSSHTNQPPPPIPSSNYPNQVPLHDVDIVPKPHPYANQSNVYYPPQNPMFPPGQHDYSAQPSMHVHSQTGFVPPPANLHPTPPIYPPQPLSALVMDEETEHRRRAEALAQQRIEAQKKREALYSQPSVSAPSDATSSSGNDAIMSSSQSAVPIQQTAQTPPREQHNAHMYNSVPGNVNSPSIYNSSVGSGGVPGNMPQNYGSVSSFNSTTSSSVSGFNSTSGFGDRRVLINFRLAHHPMRSADRIGMMADSTWEVIIQELTLSYQLSRDSMITGISLVDEDGEDVFGMITSASRFWKAVNARYRADTMVFVAHVSQSQSSDAAVVQREATHFSATGSLAVRPTHSPQSSAFSSTSGHATTNTSISEIGSINIRSPDLGQDIVVPDHRTQGNHLSSSQSLIHGAVDGGGDPHFAHSQDNQTVISAAHSHGSHNEHSGENLHINPHHPPVQNSPVHHHGEVSPNTSPSTQAPLDSHMVSSFLKACSEGDLQTAKQLVIAGVDVNVKDPIGLTAIHVASIMGRLEVAQWLLQQGASYSARDKEGMTPLHYACDNKHADIALLLARHGADSSLRNRAGITSLHIICIRGVMPLTVLIRDYMMNVATGSGLTLLHCASDQGHCDMVKHLLANGAHVHARDDEGMTPLHLACMAGHLDVAKALIDGGAYWNSRDDEGMSPLLYACQEGHYDLILMLMENEANVHVRNNAGATGLHLACESGILEVVLLLLEKRLDVNARTKAGVTPLQFAQSSGNQDLVNLLQSRGATSQPESEAQATLRVQVEGKAEAAVRAFEVEEESNLKLEQASRASAGGGSVPMVTMSAPRTKTRE